MESKNYFTNNYSCLSNLDKPHILFKYYAPLHAQTTMNDLLLDGDYASTFTLRRKDDCCIRTEKCCCENCSQCDFSNRRYSNNNSSCCSSKKC